MSQREYTIITDVNTDVSVEYAEKENIIILPQYYHFNDGIIYGDEQKLDSETFYGRLKNGEKSYSMGCNPGKVREVFESEVQKGNDILCIMFSSELSGSYSTAATIARELMEETDTTILVIDSYNASVGAGVMVHMANDLKAKGASLQLCADRIEALKKNFHAMFVVDDLQYLVRGGRLSPISGTVGNILEIKPILHLKEGKICVLKKSRTRRKAITDLLESLRELNPDSNYLIVVHTNNEESARELVTRIQEELGIKVKDIMEINPTIGAHTGPNALGFGFLSLNETK